MNVSSVSNASFSRSVTPSKSSSDRQSNDQVQAVHIENHAQERAQQQRAVQEKLQHNKDESQRRLDGRLVTFGHDQNNINNQQNQTSFNRSRVNEAYTSPRSEVSDSQQQTNQRSRERDAEAIDIVV